MGLDAVVCATGAELGTETVGATGCGGMAVGNVVSVSPTSHTEVPLASDKAAPSTGMVTGAGVASTCGVSIGKGARWVSSTWLARVLRMISELGVMEAGWDEDDGRD